MGQLLRCVRVDLEHETVGQRQVDPPDGCPLWVTGLPIPPDVHGRAGGGQAHSAALLWALCLTEERIAGSDDRYRYPPGDAFTREAAGAAEHRPGALLGGRRSNHLW